MTCELLRQDLNLDCVSVSKKYYQQIVLVNRAYVLNKRIVTSSVDIDGVYTCRNRVYFNLIDSRRGFRFSMNENSSSIFATFDKTMVENIPQYSHSVNIVVLGVTEDIKCLLTQLDYSDYFAVAQHYDGTVEVFGFDFGLSTNNYSYDPQNTSGGAVIRLASLSDALEDNPPYVYRSTEGTEIEDFNNNFQDVIFDINGDFNSDFNNDFNNQ